MDQEKSIVTIGKNQYRYNNSRNIEGEVKTVTIKRDNVGHWHVILSCDLGELYKPEKVAPMTGKSAGFDFGLSCFLTSSENEQIKSPEFLKHSVRTIKIQKQAIISKD